MIPATFIAIEGPDKVGKQTQSTLLTMNLRADGWKVKLVEVPISDSLTHPVIYWMLRQGHAKGYPRLFQFVQFLNKFLWQLFVVPYLSWKYDFVVLDRWSASAVVYGRATGISEGFLRWTYNRLFRPDRTIVLMGPSHSRKKADDSYERDTELQQRVRLEYGIWSTEEERAVQLSNQGGREHVQDRILGEIGDLL